MSTNTLDPITRQTGTAVPVRGDEIDTDRIIPARFMKSVSFEGLEQHVFEDVRIDPTSGETTDHPFNQERFQGASVLIANRNFGCGSSREHAPQCLRRWGVKALVAESFAEIFFGNCITLGIPVLTLNAADIATLMDSVERDPTQQVTVDIEAKQVLFEGGALPGEILEGPRQQLLDGTWNATHTLLVALDDIRATAARLPYVSGF